MGNQWESISVCQSGLDLRPGTVSSGLLQIERAMMTKDCRDRRSRSLVVTVVAVVVVVVVVVVIAVVVVVMMMVKRG